MNKEITDVPTQNQRRHNNLLRRPLFLVIIIAVALIIIAISLALANSLSSKTDNAATVKNDTSKTTETTEKTETKTEESTPEPSTTEEEPANPQTPIQNEGTDPNLSTYYTGVITSANKTDTDLIIRLNIDQLIKNQGNCTLALKNTDTGAEVTKTAPTVDGPASSSCQGFNVPLTELPYGNYLITVIIEADGKSGTIQGEVTI